jgi:hypothetical protein
MNLYIMARKINLILVNSFSYNNNKTPKQINLFLKEDVVDLFVVLFWCIPSSSTTQIQWSPTTLLKLNSFLGNRKSLSGKIDRRHELEQKSKKVEFELMWVP